MFTYYPVLSTAHVHATSYVLSSHSTIQDVKISVDVLLLSKTVGSMLQTFKIAPLQASGPGERRGSLELASVWAWGAAHLTLARSHMGHGPHHPMPILDHTSGCCSRDHLAIISQDRPTESHTAFPLAQKLSDSSQKQVGCDRPRRSEQQA